MIFDQLLKSAFNLPCIMNVNQRENVVLGQKVLLHLIPCTLSQIFIYLLFYLFVWISVCNIHGSVKINNKYNYHSFRAPIISTIYWKCVVNFPSTWPGLLEAWLVLTSVKYHGNLYILIPLNQWLALTRLRATGQWLASRQWIF